ncbi:MAG: hypothetical protein HRU21_13055 [Pseudomonadales bacterium]|nr:hypothetical protein [Pseudomonadales bacterium]
MEHNDWYRSEILKAASQSSRRGATVIDCEVLINQFGACIGYNIFGTLNNLALRKRQRKQFEVNHDSICTLRQNDRIFSSVLSDDFLRGHDRECVPVATD